MVQVVVNNTESNASKFKVNILECVALVFRSTIPAVHLCIYAFINTTQLMQLVPLVS